MADGVTPSRACQALLLNEPNAAAFRTLTGLNPATLYTLTFNLSGDNRPGLTYNFLLDINGTQALNVPGSWTLPAGGSGTTMSVSFLPTAGGEAVLKFYQGNSLVDPASPILDSITIPDGGATLALLGCALMGLGALRRKFRS